MDRAITEIPVRHRIGANKIRVYRTRSLKPSKQEKPWIVAKGRPGKVGTWRFTTFAEAIEKGVKNG
jgi:hypothetical protein